MKRTRAATFFTTAEHERISEAVARAELTTAGEIATMVVDSSDRYREAQVLGALLTAGIGALAICIVSGHVTVWSYIPVVLLLSVPAQLILRRFPQVILPLVGRRRLEEAVRDRAVQAFYEKGLYRTREGTGILIFISLLERKVWILGDRGINTRIVPESWQELAREMAEGIARNDPATALCTVIERCGAELARHFPPRCDDLNELPDETLR